ncbi:nitrate ABC transporter substrate-binding protein [Labrys miyagiensis]|uniref:Thiamine pyrimidine synthase n=1 Tax=Labrys miyagiensis TaxID=346912 RepID=A0ABQ6CJ52_9HYPH|nr:ABC transporter substrate-binding protein [Labrys miyagiensis]GLS20195.1 nitrate ABC transporter substrate-binding protein [Labrys miyagiensis]
MKFRGLGLGLMLAAIAVGSLFSGARAEDAPAQTKVTFVQEWPVADGFWIPWILGKQKGFYAAEGIDLDIVAPPTVADTMKFLGTGAADVAFTTVMDIVFAKDQGAPVKAIGRYGRGNNWGIIGKEGTALTVEGLKGKTVGIYNDAWTKAQLSLMLKSAKLTTDDVTMVAAADDTVPLLLQGKVDVITGITNAEGTEMVTAGKQTPSFMPAIEHGVPNTPIFMLAGNEAWLAKNPDLAKRFLKATQKSMEYAIAHPDEGPAAFAAAYSKAYDPVFINQQWKDTIPQFGKAGYDLLVLDDADWAALLAAVKDLGLVKETLPAAQYYTNDFITKGGN